MSKTKAPWLAMRRHAVAVILACACFAQATPSAPPVAPLASNSSNPSNSSTTDCGRWAGTSAVYAVSVPLWTGLLAYWAWSVHTRDEIANDLHRMLLWVPLVELVHGTVSIAYFELCPWEADLSALVATVWVVLTILREPVILFCLLMVAKGWCLTREVLTAHEITVACVIASLMYLSIISMYALALLDVPTAIATLPTLTMYLAMLCNVMMAISTNLRFLKARITTPHATHRPTPFDHAIAFRTARRIAF